jgi:ammonium transporter, Amt family
MYYRHFLLVVVVQLLLVQGFCVQAWAQDVNTRLLTVYERISVLQDRIHALEAGAAKQGDVQALQRQLQQVQAMVEPGFKDKQNPKAVASAVTERRLLALEGQVAQLAQLNSLGATSVGGNGQGANLGGRQPDQLPHEAAGPATLLGERGMVALNHVWIILSAILVMFMQVGFALVESGLTRGKNAAHTLTMNLMDYGIGMLAFWAVGFGLMFGGVGAIESLGISGDLLNRSLGVLVNGEKISFAGLTGFFLNGLTSTPVMSFFFFQMVFAATANTICTGTLAERWKFRSFTLASVFMAGIIYPVFGSWVWGGGWLQAMGFTDFAGSMVVHAAGGIIAITGAKALGARKGKFEPTGEVRAIPGHNLPFVFLGTFILAFSWFGFNAGSTLQAGYNIGLIATNTALASAAGAISALFITYKKFGKPDPTFACNGMLAGLVAITAGCAFVAPWAAVVIGVVAGVLVVFSALFIEEKLRLDDPVGAISVHGTNGIWGILAVGLFAVPELHGQAGLVYGAVNLLLVQAVGVLAGIGYFLAAGIILFGVLGKITRMRASDAEQEEGLDLAEMGVTSYN